MNLHAASGTSFPLACVQCNAADAVRCTGGSGFAKINSINRLSGAFACEAEIGRLLVGLIDAMLEQLRIQHFRGIPDLLLDDLSRVNVFIGTNGAGKTTVLEAISVVANPTAAPWLVTLSGWREMPKPSLEQNDALRSYFDSLDVTVPPSLAFVIDGQQVSMSIEAELGTGAFSSNPDAAKEPSSSNEPQTELRAINITYNREHIAPARSRLEIIEGGFRATPAPNVPRIGAFYIHARRSTSPGETARLLTFLYETKRESELLGILKQVDGRVKRLWPGVRDVGATILVDVGLPRMLPMTVLGDGFCRVVLMSTGLFLTNSRFLIVDEIDSGLHYSVMQPVWNGLTSISGAKQIFCATHNEEMLHATLDAFAADRNALRIFRIDRKEDGSVVATKYTYESFRVSSAAGLEIR